MTSKERGTITGSILCFIIYFSCLILGGTGKLDQAILLFSIFPLAIGIFLLAQWETLPERRKKTIWRRNYVDWNTVDQVLETHLEKEKATLILHTLMDTAHVEKPS